MHAEHVTVPAAAATSPRAIQATYLGLTASTTLATSMIWGINTIFLLDAGLTNLEAFAANAFYTVGLLLFEIPTGVVADLRGRRLSFLLGSAVLAASTALYVLLWVWESPFWGWAAASVLLGFGYTFFSGAIEAWVVDALRSAGYEGSLDGVFGRAQAASGAAMLVGSVLGGVLAQVAGLWLPFVLRSALLVVSLVAAAIWMHDLGFSPMRERAGAAMRDLLRVSVDVGLRDGRLRWLMLAGPFIGGSMGYVFYAAQPYLLELYGDDRAFALAGIVAALVAAAQIVGGMLAAPLRRVVHLRTTLMLASLVVSTAALVVAGLTSSFWVAVAALAVWGLALSTLMPVRRAYLNACIPSQQRATVLSFDSLLGSVGGFVQPAFGRAADLQGYGVTIVASSVLQAMALPFVVATRRRRDPVDAGEV
ncbi:Predicted arabinose efflux permease, MFS family [Agrococcus jejuensis]|uniref:Predicted arabinose efflux permease, MFS family n=1 Tax=Agrococcus jejuensis TaxID=399736 RepID=A0A1G8GM67_9MICO|nr:Predicted arabinose efflux permease, MFS family [Agrococcus jejuensis]